MALVCTGNMLKDYGPNSHAVTMNRSGTYKQLGYTPFDKGVYNPSNHGNSAIITNARASSWLQLPASADLYDWNPSSDHFTLEFWLYSKAFRVGSPNNTPCVFAHATGTNNTYYWGLGTNASVIYICITIMVCSNSNWLNSYVFRYLVSLCYV